MRIFTRFWRWWYRHHPEPSKYTRAEALEIARKYKLDPSLVEQIVRLYVTHPGVDVDGIMTKMGM